MNPTPRNLTKKSPRGFKKNSKKISRLRAQFKPSRNDLISKENLLGSSFPSWSSESPLKIKPLKTSEFRRRNKLLVNEPDAEVQVLVVLLLRWHKKIMIKTTKTMMTKMTTMSLTLSEKAIKKTKMRNTIKHFSLNSLDIIVLLNIL